ncbi:MAG: 50S ribosomal protein L19 [Mycoplasma sp.]|nr:50S ribosomal protein L19 [Mycoplasma sp.]
MRHPIIEKIESRFKRSDLPNLEIGQNIKVHVRIKETNKERIQIFEGLVIAIKGEGNSKTFTVRKISYNIGIERTFPYNSPLISHIDIVKSNKVRRSKLYYIRNLHGKSARLKEKKLIKK